MMIHHDDPLVDSLIEGPKTLRVVFGGDFLTQLLRHPKRRDAKEEPCKWTNPAVNLTSS